jgi:aspartyl aminopeptidase
MIPENTYSAELADFITSSPTAFHAAASAAALLREKGFIQLSEQDSWNRLPTGRYFVVRNDSSLIGFVWRGDGENRDNRKNTSIQMVGAHTDSPGLKVKPSPMRKKQNCLQLGVEVYGGALLRPWFDRELSLAGRVCWYDDGKESGSVDSGRAEKIHSSLIDFKRPVAIIPNLAIHLNHEANKKQEVNRQTDLVPVIGLTDENEPDFLKILEEQLCRQYPELKRPRITDHELFLYDAAPPALIGLTDQFITGARLDNLVSCFAALQALLAAESDKIDAADEAVGNCLIILSDHEEVGSVSTCGAQGSFLRDILERLLPEAGERQAVLRNSLLISADNAHAMHPNFADRHDPQYLPLMNNGPVIKFNAGQRYATNAGTAAEFRMLCKRAEVPVQEFVMRNDMGCGSTIGPLTAAEIGIDTVDVGIPSLAMHSIRETAACLDCWYLYRVLRIFFSRDY